VTFAIQAASETQDILIPHRKRQEFLTSLLDNIGPHLDKVCLAVIDKQDWEKDKYHPGLHSKSMIVDDEIAIIGSANVNQRSFTYDSETSVIVFDEDGAKKKFASNLRRKILTDFLRVKKSAPGPDDPDMFAAQWLLPTIVNGAVDANNDPIKNAFILNRALLPTKDKNVAGYKSDENDLDDKIIVYLSNSSVSIMPGTISITVKGQSVVDKFVVSEESINGIFNTLWDTVIDPEAK
jgi:hypothetical protein